MKKLLLFLELLLAAHFGFSQTYIPMPVDSAIWRYRFRVVDNVTQVTDYILFVDGKDTTINGIKYEKIFSRTCAQIGSSDLNPPMVNVDATLPDAYFGAMREANEQVYIYQGSAEQMIFDFTATVGTAIPTYSGKVTVTSIDSIVLTDSKYHRRFLTTDPGYSVIEGVGSTRGLVPYLLDPASSSLFICLTNDAVEYQPRTDTPCAYIYPYGYEVGVPQINTSIVGINIYPIPVNDIVHIITRGEYNATVYDNIGRVKWKGVIRGASDIPVSSWQSGVYYIRFTSDKNELINKLLIKQ